MRNTRSPIGFAGALIACLILTAGPILAADHVDLPQDALGDTLERPDASISDFWAFTADDKLVLIMGLHPFLAGDVTHYQFPTDVTYAFHVDIDSAVTIDSSTISNEFGGVIASPGDVAEDVTLEVTFNGPAGPHLSVTGASAAGTRVWAGLRAEAFIFAPFARNNIAGIVVEVPLANVAGGQDELLLWATASVDVPGGVYTELGGRALRSQFFVDLNPLHPSDHAAAGFSPPDVVILDTSAPSAFPNGRTLRDNVNAIAAGFVTLPTDPVAAELEVDFCEPGGPFYPCPVPVPATADDMRLRNKYPWLGNPFRN